MKTPVSDSVNTFINVSNIRLGFATNSSSTHSIVINPERFGEVEWPLQSFLRANLQEFNESYRITDQNHRLVLFAKSLYSSLVPAIGTQAAQAVVCEFCCVDRHVLTHYETNDTVSMVIPVTEKVPSNKAEGFSTDQGPQSTFCEAYLRDLMSFLVSNKSVGWIRTRDNDDGLDEEGGDLKHKLSSGHGSELSLDPRLQWVARADGQWWVLMNRLTGAKLRLNFSDMNATYTKSTLPELVDIKITDYCPYNCSFCYQGSTISGKHAPERSLERCIELMRRMGVFEVAIGGGEPTLHPQFNMFLNDLYDKNIQPNFTTRNIAYFNKPENLKSIQSTGARFAVSVDTLAAAKAVIPKLKEIPFSREIADGIKVPASVHEYGKTKNPYTLQVILGTDAKAVMDILLYANEQRVDVTLLGYKTTGRGAIDLTVKGTTLEKLQSSYATEFNKKIAKLISTYKFNIFIGVDTLAIEQLPFLKDPKYSYQVTPAEGKFSMYIDAVADKMARSSYVEPEDYTSLIPSDYKPKEDEDSDHYNSDQLSAAIMDNVVKTFSKW